MGNNSLTVITYWLNFSFKVQFSWYKKWSFLLRISSVNVTKSAEIINGKLHFLCSVLRVLRRRNPESVHEGHFFFVWQMKFLSKCLNSRKTRLPWKIPDYTHVSGHFEEHCFWAASIFQPNKKKQMICCFIWNQKHCKHFQQSWKSHLIL